MLAWALALAWLHTTAYAQADFTKQNDPPPPMVQVFEAQTTNIVARVFELKTATADHFAKYGNLKISPDFEAALVREGYLETKSTNLHVRIVKGMDKGGAVTAFNTAYSLDGSGTNQIGDGLLVEAIVKPVPAKIARELSQMLDGKFLTSPPGKEDLRGRVKYAAIPANGTGEVRIYVTHR